MEQTDLFLNYSYSIGPSAKKKTTLKLLHEKYKYEHKIYMIP